AVGALTPDATEGCGNLVVGRAGSDECSQVVSGGGEEACVEGAVGREAGARARPAERARHRGDDADLAASVPVAVALRDLAGIARRKRLEGKLGVDRGD